MALSFLKHNVAAWFRSFHNALFGLHSTHLRARRLWGHDLEILEDRSLPSGLFISGVGGGTQASDPELTVYSTRGSNAGQAVLQLEAFPGMVGDTRLAVGDVNGDGTDDIIAAAGVGGGSEIRIFDGASALQGNQNLIARFFAYSDTAGASQNPGFGGGVYVSSEDLNGDGFAEVFTTPGSGGRGHVKVFDFNGGGSFLGSAPVLRASVYTFTDYNGEVRVASMRSGDDVFLVTSSGAGVPGDVRLFNQSIYNLGSVPDGTPVPSQFLAARLVPFSGYSGGLSVAAGDTDADGSDELFVSKNDGPSIVEVYRLDDLIQSSGQGNFSPSPMGSFEAFPGFLGQVRLGSADIDGDGRAEVLTTTGFSGDPQGTPVKAFHREADNTFSLRVSFYSNPGYLPGAWLPGKDLHDSRDPLAHGRYSRFLGTSGDSQYIADPNNRVIKINNAGRETLGEGVAAPDGSFWFLGGSSGTNSPVYRSVGGQLTQQLGSWTDLLGISPDGNVWVANGSSASSGNGSGWTPESSSISRALVQATDLGKKIIEYARQFLPHDGLPARRAPAGSRGECTDLAEAALRYAGAKTTADYGISGPNADYRWGTLVSEDHIYFTGGLQIEDSLLTTYPIRPGDIIQYRDVTVTTNYPNGSSYTSTASHHTAIIESILDHGNFRVLEQNWDNGAQSGRVVREAIINLGDMTQGHYWIYQPVAR